MDLERGESMKWLTLIINVVLMGILGYAVSFNLTFSFSFRWIYYLGIVFVIIWNYWYGHKYGVDKLGLIIFGVIGVFLSMTLRNEVRWVYMDPTGATFIFLFVGGVSQFLGQYLKTPKTVKEIM